MTPKNIFLSLFILLFSLTCDKAATTLPLDCLGIAGGSATVDECGVCDANPYNDNLFPPTQEATDTTELIIGCMDCTAEVGGIHWYDDCNICDAYINYGGEKPNYPYGICDCAGVPDGDAMIDYCGDCEGTCENGNTDSCERLDDCNVCDGDNAPNTGICDCFSVPGGTSVKDCEGVCDGDAIKDCAQICNGTSATDNAGECCEEDLIDQCEICNGDNSPNTGICDCAGTPDGNEVEDNCGVCGGDNSTCSDCTGLLGGTAELDDCGICSNGNTGIESNIDQDCFGTCTDASETKADEEWLIENPCPENGMAWNESQNSCKETGAVVDNCGACVDNISNGCVEDCQGVWGGSAQCGCFINNADNYYCGDCFGNGELCINRTFCLSDNQAINPFININENVSTENEPYCNENPDLTINECLCEDGSIIATANNEFLGNCYNLSFGQPNEICDDCDTGNSWNGGNFYHDPTLCEYYGCANPDAANYDNLATNCENGSLDSCCEYLGCTSEDAMNFDSEANFDDGSCIYHTQCTDEDAINYNPSATVDDGSCNNYISLQELDSQTLNINIYNTTDIYGFQFNVSNILFESASAATNEFDGFSVSTSNNGNTVIGFSMTGSIITNNLYEPLISSPALLTTLQVNIVGESPKICVTNLVFSGEASTTLLFESSCIE